MKETWLVAFQNNYSRFVKLWETCEGLDKPEYSPSIILIIVEILVSYIRQWYQA